MQQHDSSDSSVSCVVGIDVSKTMLDGYVDSVGQWIHMANDADGVAQVIAQLRTLKIQLVVIEATGRLHRRLASELLLAGIPVALVNPQRAREFARASGRLEKTDRIDGRVLAEFGRGVKLRTLEKFPEKQVDLDDLISRAAPWSRCASRRKTACTTSCPDSRTPKAKSFFDFIDQQIEDLDKAIADLIDGDDDWQRKSQIITSVPGVSDGTANQLIADLPELGMLSRQRIAKLVGVAPLADDSGDRKGTRRINGGRGPVRNALYMAAFNAMRYCERFKRMADQLRKRGKVFKVIVTACMRKLLVTLNQMVKTNTIYNASLNVSIP